ncbi:hypothetical protein L484_008544 [Morus notabilis]|uniref:Uncharacterized protein n=1 Tax=Morus notabilis TaxID=981085 RepID=W9S757_9ROSA|nr:hypothetical protein L484_008544 [Morus notabilis]
MQIMGGDWVRSAWWLTVGAIKGGLVMVVDSEGGFTIGGDNGEELGEVAVRVGGGIVSGLARGQLKPTVVDS